jgi:SAM-dependent methyltransferase
MPEGEIFTPSEYETVYPSGIERHFWNVARNNLIYRWLKTRLRPDDLVMDVGCGTGIVVNDLKARGVNIRGVELGEAPVMPGLESDIDTGKDLFDLDASLKIRINALLLLDVIEHVIERRQLLQRIYRECPNCRFILVTVPARMELWSSYDEHWGHHLRYDRPRLRADFEGSGFQPVRTSYFFHWLYLASLLMTLLGIHKSTDFQPIEHGGAKAQLHRLLGWVTRLESRIIPGFAVGSSIACLAVRGT